MERDIINAYLSRFRKEVFADEMEVYFNSNNQVLGIKTPFSTVIAVSNADETRDIKIISYLFNGQTADVDCFSKKIFIIPSKNDVVLYKDVDEPDKIMLSAFPAIYELLSYGVLEEECYKNTVMTKCLIRVLISNTASQYYETIFLTGDNIIAGSPIKVGDDVYYDGKVTEGYQFATIGRFMNDMIVLNLKKE